MRLYIWEGDGVLTDYTNGMIVALANDLDTALLEIEKTCNYCMSSFPHLPSETVELGDSAAAPKAWVTWGGG